MPLEMMAAAKRTPQLSCAGYQKTQRVKEHVTFAHYNQVVRQFFRQRLNFFFSTAAIGAAQGFAKTALQQKIPLRPQDVQLFHALRLQLTAFITGCISTTITSLPVLESTPPPQQQLLGLPIPRRVPSPDTCSDPARPGFRRYLASRAEVAGINFRSLDC